MLRNPLDLLNATFIIPTQSVKSMANLHGIRSAEYSHLISLDLSHREIVREENTPTIFPR